MTSTGFGWANSENKPSKKGKTANRKNRWDVDSATADRIYDGFTRWDREESSFSHLFSWEKTDRYAGVDETQVQRLRTSQVMVQTFVDALSGEQSNYTVGLSATAITATSDLRNRVMKLPAKTILDPELTEQEAALLMVAFLGHEIGHVRFDNDLDGYLARDNTVPDSGLYNTLSTILRESRVEAGFSGLFPGYTGLFEPLLRWISRETKDGSTPPSDALGFAVAATRYPFRFDWSNPVHASERDWWTAWVYRYQNAEDYPTHRAALDEAYQHIKTVLNPDSGEGGEGQPGQSGTPSDAPYSSESDAEGRMSGYELAAAKSGVEYEYAEKRRDVRAKAQDGTISYDDMYDALAKLDKEERKSKTALTKSKNQADKAAASIPSSVEQVAEMKKEQDAKKSRRRSRHSAAAQAENEVMKVTEKANMEAGLRSDGTPLRSAGVNSKGTHNRAMGGVATDADAVGIFRSAFLRLRGGNEGRIGGKRTGRLDDRRIYRLADRQDDHVFTRRGAAKTQALRVYLMVDTSGSMSGQPAREIRSVAKALIEASIGANNLTLEVFGWDTSVTPVWQRGEDPDEVLRLNPSGGTADASSLKWATDRMEQNLRVGEHGLIIMMSDGEGDGNILLHTVTEQARRKGMSVFGITMSDYLDQTEAYGKNGFIKWQGSVAKTALPLAQIITQSWMTKDQHRA